MTKGKYTETMQEIKQESDERHSYLYNTVEEAMADYEAAMHSPRRRSEPNYPVVGTSKKPTRTAKAGYVYLLQSPTNAYKIGISKRPDDRLRTFSVKLPFEISYVCLIATQDMYGLETKLHAQFADKRINGEWFALDDADVEYIKEME